MESQCYLFSYLWIDDDLNGRGLGMQLGLACWEAVTALRDHADLNTYVFTGTVCLVGQNTNTLRVYVDLKHATLRLEIRSYIRVLTDHYLTFLLFARPFQRQASPVPHCVRGNAQT